MQIRIVTDDLTSALDGTACFAERGWTPSVLIRQDTSASAEVISYDTNSRERRDTEGADLVAAAAFMWGRADVLVLQFDSTLRGNIARDCLAAYAASGRAKLVLAPAFPTAGRTTKGGTVLLGGIPVHETEFGNDPTWPVGESSIQRLFADQGVVIGLARDAATAEVMARESGVIVVDAQSEQDLDEIARTFAGDPDVVLAGSTGLLRALARTLRGDAYLRAHQREAVLGGCLKPWLVVGSMNPRSRRQLAVAQGHGVPWIATGGERLSTGESLKALDALVEQVVETIRRGACDGLVVTGGETARRIVDAIPSSSLRVTHEVLPGVPAALISTPNGEIPMITKAGGFGDDTALLYCLQALTGHPA